MAASASAQKLGFGETIGRWFFSPEEFRTTSGVVAGLAAAIRTGYMALSGVTVADDVALPFIGMIDNIVWITFIIYAIIRFGKIRKQGAGVPMTKSDAKAQAQYSAYLQAQRR